jgi:2-iminoacetate synthase ThiH
VELKNAGLGSLPGTAAEVRTMILQVKCVNDSLYLFGNYELQG